MSKFISFFGRSFYKHPILWSIFGIAITLVVIFELTVLFLVHWTHHGETAIVPDVVGMRYKQGVAILEDAGLEVICNDSVFMKDVPPGTITDIIPAPNSVVKAGREVYVTRVCFMPQTIVIEREISDYTVREFENMLKHYDIMFVEEKVPSEVDGNLVGVNYKRKRLGLGDKIAVGDMVTVLIGKKVEIFDEDDDPLDLVIGLPSSNSYSSEGVFSEGYQPINAESFEMSAPSGYETNETEELPINFVAPNTTPTTAPSGDPLDAILENLATSGNAGGD